MKRIAIFTSVDSFETWFGGVFGLSREQYASSYRNDWVWEYAIGLRNLGHDVFIYILTRGPAQRLEALSGITVCFVALTRWHRLVDPLLYRLDQFLPVSTLRARTEYLAYQKCLLSMLQQDRIDVLYNQEFWTSRFDEVARHIPLPLVGADHGALPKGLTRIKRRTFKAARKLVCQSEDQLKRVTALGGDAVMITNGVNTEFFSPCSEARGKWILAVGRISDQQKRYSDLIHAMLHLPDFVLRIVGSGEDEGRLRTLVSDLGLEGRVNFDGFISDRIKLRDMYRTAGVFVSCSAWEAMALVMLEAMSCATAVVGTKIPTFEALIRDGVDGVLAPVGAPGQLAQAIGCAYALRDRLGVKARETVSLRFSARKSYSALSNLIEAL
jgi:glycosyltransferase involved in cell wall biosynthesis